MHQQRQLKNSSYSLSRKEIKKLINATPKFRDRVIIKLLAGCGLRREEVCDLPIMAINFKKGLLRIVGKGNKLRMVPCSQDILNDVLHYLGNRKKGPVFPSCRNKGRPISWKRLNDICIKSAKLAGVEHPNPDKKNINPHLFRHTFAHRFKDAGMRLDVLQAVMGHFKFETTMDLYGTPSLAQIQQEVEAVEFI